MKQLIAQRVIPSSHVNLDHVRAVEERILRQELVEMMGLVGMIRYNLFEHRAGHHVMEAIVNGTNTSDVMEMTKAATDCIKIVRLPGISSSDLVAAAESLANKVLDIMGQ